MANPQFHKWTPNRARTLWLCASLTLVLLPHVTRMPIWVTVGFVLLTFWRIEHVINGARLPSRLTRVVLSLGIVVGVYLSFGTLFGRSAGIAALAILAGMKLLETESLRDAYATVFLGFFLVITNFLYSQSIPTGVYMVFVVIVITATLIAVNSDSDTFDMKKNLRYATRMLGHAVPLMLILFVLFPRIPGPLWGLPKDANNAVSGLSDSMSPGAISQLGLSSAVAFRVKFDGPIPPTSQLYWRGPVFTKTDGRQWSSTRKRTSAMLPSLSSRGEAVYYTITQEPQAQAWIFALDVPGVVHRNMRITQDYQLLATRTISERQQFRLRSYLNARPTYLSPRQRTEALTLPAGAHPRTQELAEGWLTSNSNPRELVNKALALFRTKPFFYTLSPPALLDDPVDQFLFETQKGFCEHYAASFTVLMRFMGIPSRVVTGYQGGEVNPLGDYVIVRQRDAHAWAEVWFDDEGWVRIDPTAAVSPQRIESGMDAAIVPEFGPSTFVFEPGGKAAELLTGLRHGWDSVNNSWNQWVLGYGAKKQRDFLALFGLDGDWRNLLLWLLFLILALMVLIAIVVLRRRPSGDPVVLAYERFCTKLANIGIKRRTSEGPVEFMQRISTERPDLMAETRRVTDIYVAIRYAAAKIEPKVLNMAVAAFRP